MPTRTSGALVYVTGKLMYWIGCWSINGTMSTAMDTRHSRQVIIGNTFTESPELMLSMPNSTRLTFWLHIFNRLDWVSAMILPCCTTMSDVKFLTVFMPS